MRKLFTLILAVASIAAIESQARTTLHKAGEQSAYELSSVGPQRAPAKASPMRYPKGGLRLIGNVTATQDGKDLGIHSISAVQDEAEAIRTISATDPGFMANGVYYSPSLQDWGWMVFVYYYMYDIDTWEGMSYLTFGPQQLPVCAAYDAVTNRVYGSFYADQNRKTYCFGYMDASYLTMDRAYYLETVEICSQDKPLSAMAFDNQGACYAIDSKGNFGQVDTATGDFAEIAPTGYNPAYVGGMAYDPEGGCFYWNAVPNAKESYLCKIEPENGEVVTVYQFGNFNQVVGMYVPAPEAADKAPARAENLTLNFDGGSLAGNVAFDIPTECYDGTALSGNIGWILKLNDDAAATGTAQPGAAITADLSVPESNNYEIAVSLSNEAGPSPEAKVARWIGEDTPSAVQNITLEYVDGALRLGWDAVDGSVNDGYVDYGSVTYSVVAYPAAMMVANHSRDTSFSMAVDEKSSYTEYYFTVQAHYGDNDGAITESPHLAVGYIYPPFLDQFTQDIENRYTVIDANGDNNSWYASIWDGEVVCNAPYGSDSDDWLISPPLYLEQGVHYLVSWDIHSYKSSWNENDPDDKEVMFEIWAGKQPTVAGMTIPLVEYTTHVGVTPVKYSQDFVPDEDGQCYIALRNLTPKDGGGKMYFSIYASNFCVSAGSVEGAPLAPTDLSASTARDGSLMVTIQGKAPMQDNIGNDLQQLSRIDIYRDGAFVGSVEQIAPGEEFSYVDTGMTAGVHAYVVAAINEAGKGATAEISCQAGPSVPKCPENVTAVETSAGTVEINWVAPCEDINGVSLASSDLSFDVVKIVWGERTTVARGIKDTSYCAAVDYEAGAQQFVTFAVLASNNAGTSGGTESAIIPVGDAYNMTFVESFEEGMLRYSFGVTSGMAAQWGLGLDYYFSSNGITSQDGDNGLLYFGGELSAADSGVLTTGKVLIEAVDPVLSFWTYAMPDVANEFVVSIHAEGLAQELVRVSCGAAVAGWQETVVDLGSYAGKEAYFEFEASIKNLNYMFIDNLHVKADVDHNLTLLDSTAPSRVNPNQKFGINVTLENNGRIEADDFEIVVLGNDQEEIARYVSPSPIEAGQKVWLQLPMTLTPAFDRNVSYGLAVEMASDQFLADNDWGTGHITLNLPHYPAVSGLEGEIVDDCPVLRWNAIDENVLSMETVIEDFEGFAHGKYSEIGDWTLVDADGALAGGFDGYHLGVEALPISFFVLGQGAEASGINFSTMSGNNVLASVYNYNDASDDWAISPLLSGDAQTVSFWATSYSAGYPESFEFLISSSDTEMGSFTRLQSVANVPAAWTEYVYELPAGTKYFAIRCVSQGNLLFMVDDVTYCPRDGAELALELKGYNVYRNGVKLNGEPVMETTFTDEVGQGGTYAVTAIYDLGESESSNRVTLSANGIESVVADSENAVFYTPSGIKVDNPRPGQIYIIRQGDAASKSLVK